MAAIAILAADGRDESVGAAALPFEAGLGILLVLGTDPAVEPERPHGHERNPSLRHPRSALATSTPPERFAFTITTSNARASAGVRIPVERT